MSPRAHTGSPRSAIEAGRLTRRTLIQGSVAALAVLALPSLPAGAAGSGALVRYVNVAVGQPLVDVYIDGERVAEELAFGKATKPARQPGGTRELAVVPAGGTVGQAVLTTTLVLDETLRYIIPISGESPDFFAFAFGVLVQALDPDTARLRLLHLAPDLGSIDFGPSDSTTIFQDVWYGGATPYADHKAGTLDLEIRPTGASDVLLRRDAVELEEGRVYDLLVYGLAADDSLRTLLLTATAESADEPATTSPPTAAEKTYLTSLKESASLLDQTFVNLDRIFTILETNPDGALNALAFVCMGWVITHQEVEQATAPPRYEALKTAFLSVLEPLATTARQMSNVDDYLSGAAPSFNFTALDLNLLLQTITNVLPLHELANADLDAALREAGLPAD